MGLPGGRAATSVRVRVGGAELFNTVLGRECESETTPNWLRSLPLERRREMRSS